jgi:hypothetical protein
MSVFGLKIENQLIILNGFLKSFFFFCEKIMCFKRFLNNRKTQKPLKTAQKRQNRCMKYTSGY